MLPLGGMVQPTSQDHTAFFPMVPGEKFTEQMSGKKARIRGAMLKDNDVLPCSGGEQAILDAVEIALEQKVRDALGIYLETVTGRWQAVLQRTWYSESKFKM